MKNLIKKFRVFAIIGALTCAQVAHPPKANAIAGAAALGSGVASGVGIGLLAVGGVAFLMLLI